MGAEEIEMKPVNGGETRRAGAETDSDGNTVIELDGNKKPSSGDEWVVFLSLHCL